MRDRQAEARFLRGSDFPDQRVTAHGILYKPPNFALQVLFLIAAFAGGPAIGWIFAATLGGVSDVGQLFLYVPPILIFFLGYGLWASRLAAIAFDAIGKQILWVIFDVVFRRKKPPELKDVITIEKLEEMAVRAQKASSSFLIVTIPIAAASALLAALIESDSNLITRALVVAGGSSLWGYLLSALGRRGYLPLPEGDD